MRNINHAILSTTLRNKSTKKESVTLHPSLLVQLMYSLSNQLSFSEENVKAYETALWIKSQHNLVGNKGRTHTKSYRPKEIIKVDLGNNAFGTEFSYLHPCVVIYNEYRKVFVVPCTSQPAKRDTKGNLFPEYLEGKGGLNGDGFETHTTVLINEARFIDKTRIVDRLGNVTDTFYKGIYDKLFSMIFESKLYSLNKAESLKDNLEKELQQAKKEIAMLQGQIATMEAASDEK